MKLWRIFNNTLRCSLGKTCKRDVDFILFTIYKTAYLRFCRRYAVCFFELLDVILNQSAEAFFVFLEVYNLAAYA